MEESSVNHVEGGWPEHVKPELIEHRNKFIRQVNKSSEEQVSNIFLSDLQGRHV
jgi:hypothetical protein